MNRPGIAPLGMWAGLSVPVLACTWLRLEEPAPLWRPAAGLAALAVATALHRRRRPVAAFALAAAPGLAFAPALFTLSYGAALAVLAHLMGLRALTTRPALLTFAALAAAGTAKIAARQVDPTAEWLVLMATLLFGAVFPWLAGRHRRQSRELAAAGWARAEQLEREHRIVADRARLRERARIAQDMHDSLGHELSLIALRAGALQVAKDLPGPHREAAAELRAAASDATDRLHGIIGLLREEDDEPAPLAPPGETVAELVERAAASGLPVQLHGTPPPEDRTAYRVVQEALTNAAKHAPGAAVTVETTRAHNGRSSRDSQDSQDSPDSLTITVTTAGPASRARQGSTGTGTGTGTGLQALRTRVTDLGGTFEAGPHAEGFRVRATLPTIPTRSTAVPPDPRTRTPGTARAFVAAAVAGTVLTAGAFTWYAYRTTHAVLTPRAYATLPLGTPEADAEQTLPALTISDPPVDRAPAPPPPGTDCRYYRASGELFVSVDHFRLCFAAKAPHALIDKTLIPRTGQ
ncbi:sensor histidine kinase [Streptomyces xanthii]|uniref:histidine kinase n=1 Tax=Streptomyces xanthii TaxID=2768069 RepID=A0A7H1BA59_9ACTN|nr:histidine kinase [Streptomyces xanthii]QNS05614.1 ATP-binding protein [Streptomyces xanthii]